MSTKNFVDEQISNVVKASKESPDWLYDRYKDKLPNKNLSSTTKTRVRNIKKKHG